MESNDRIVNQLREDELKNINLLNFMEDYPVESVEIEGRSLLVRGRSDQTWNYISSSDENELRSLKSRFHDKDRNFAAIEDWIVPVLLEDRKTAWDLSMTQYYLPDRTVIPKSEIESAPLTLADAETVYENSEYKEAISISYVKDRIARGISVGLHERNRLIAWGMTQDDGGMGFLHVLPEYRRMKYGYHVTLRLIEELRKKGKMPFVYIEKDNFKSRNLALSLCFKEQKGLHWLQLNG